MGGLRTVVNVVCHQQSLSALEMMLAMFVMSVASLAHTLTIKQWYDAKHDARHRTRRPTGSDTRAKRKPATPAVGIPGASQPARLVPLGRGSWLYRIEHPGQSEGEQSRARNSPAVGVLLILLVLPELLFALALLVSNALGPVVPARRGSSAGRGRKLGAGAGQ